MDEMPQSANGDGGAPGVNGGGAGNGDNYGPNGGCNAAGVGAGDAWAVLLAALVIAKRKRR